MGWGCPGWLGLMHKMDSDGEKKRVGNEHCLMSVSVMVKVKVLYSR